jgi:general secretion pathway protein L
VAKVIELPAVAGANLRRMVGFELERHVPFSPAEAVFDFDLLAGAPGRPVRVLLVAAERRVFERVRVLLREAGLVPRLVDAAIHGLGFIVEENDRTASGGRLLVRLEPGEAEFVIVRDGRLRLSRAVPLPEDPAQRGPALVREVRRSLASLAAEEREAVTAVSAVGEGLPAGDWDELPAPAPMPEPAALAAVDAAFLPAAAMALRRPRRDRPGINLVPDELRPRPFPWPVAVTAALALAALLVAVAIPIVTLIRDERALAALDGTVARQAPDVRRVEQLMAEVQRAGRDLDALRGFERDGVRALPVLRELTELLPPDVWLTSFSADRGGIELTGFAGSAAQLIPLLEASPTFERVEFTSPVTKGRDREQFRLRATWEPPGGGRPAGAGGPLPAAPGRAAASATGS